MAIGRAQGCRRDTPNASEADDGDAAALLPGRGWCHGLASKHLRDEAF
jgi:hypothetical protein